MGLIDAPLNYVRNSQVWNSIFRHGVPRDRRTRVMAVMSNVFLHLHPVAVRKSGIRLSFTWCMGGLTFFLFLAETVSGVLLMFYYRPVIEYAYQDIQDLRAHITLGVLREIHRWGAHAMIIAIWLHMMRVFLTGSYKPPREFNWCVGVILLVLTMLLSFTGYLLPWDQLAIWAITVGSNMARATPLLGNEGPGAAFLTLGGQKLIHVGSDARFALIGGRTIGGATLIRFYVLHCVGIPLVAAFLMAVHFWRVRKDGGISGPM
jgi:cytochrome b6